MYIYVEKLEPSYLIPKWFKYCPDCHRNLICIKQISILLDFLLNIHICGFT